MHSFVKRHSKHSLFAGGGGGGGAEADGGGAKAETATAATISKKIIDFSGIGIGGAHRHRDSSRRCKPARQQHGQQCVLDIDDNNATGNANAVNDHVAVADVHRTQSNNTSIVKTTTRTTAPLRRHANGSSITSKFGWIQRRSSQHAHHHHQHGNGNNNNSSSSSRRRTYHRSHSTNTSRTVCNSGGATVGVEGVGTKMHNHHSSDNTNNFYTFFAHSLSIDQQEKAAQKSDHSIQAASKYNNNTSSEHGSEDGIPLITKLDKYTAEELREYRQARTNAIGQK